MVLSFRAAGAGRGFIMVVHPARKFERLEDIQRQLSTDEMRAFEPLWANWEALLMAPDEVIAAPPVVASGRAGGDR